MPRRICHGPGWWQGKFRGCGYRITAARELVLGVLSQTTDHLSVEDIYTKLRSQHPRIGLTTIYRTLEALTDAGLVFKLGFGDGKARYELAEGPKGAHHHHHLVCDRCNKVIDYTDFINEEVELLRKTEKGLSQKYSFKITNHLIQFHGLCSDCAGK